MELDYVDNWLYLRVLQYVEESNLWAPVELAVAECKGFTVKPLI